MTRTFSKDYLYLYFIVIPFFVPVSITNGYFSSGVEIAFRLWKLLAMMIICFLLVKKNFRIDKPFLLLLLFFGVIIFSTYLHDGLLSQQVNLAASWIFFFLFFALEARQNPEGILTCISNILVVFVVLNLISVILYPNALFLSKTGMRNWFLGDRNIFISYCVPGICASLVCDEVDGRKFSHRSIVMVVASLAQIILVWSATSVVSIFALTLILTYPLITRRYPTFLNLKLYSAATLVVFLAFVIFRFQEYFSTFLIQGLGKELTLTGRTYIWADAMEIISNNILIGQGAQERISTFSVWSGEFEVSHAHDIYLQIMCIGGVTALIIILLLVLFASRNVARNSNQRISYTISACLGIMFIAACFDYYQTIPLCMLLAVATYSQYFEPRPNICVHTKIGSHR